MLNILTVSNYATYKTEIQRLGPLNRINFVFGNNGSGKTSLTRLLCKQETELPAGCGLDWARGNRLVPYVYNVDYVRKNFVASDRISGVFSLGREDVTLKKRLDEFDEKISGLTDKISKLTTALNGDGSPGTNYARAVLDQAKEKLIDFFWKNVKVQYDADFRILFDGKRGKKSDFCSLCLPEFTKREGVKITPLKIEDLKSRVWALSDKTQQIRSFLPTFNVESLRCYETAFVLEKVIVGRSDVDIANLVASLGNSDWVSNGRSYLHNSNGVCPFCQQLLPADFEATLNHYFDDSYAKDIASLEKLKTDYEREAGSLINQFRGYCALCPELKNNQKFCNAGKLLVSIYEKNVAQLQKKILSPSLKIQLEETQGILTEILECVVAENEVIKRDNKLISEREVQTGILRRDFWDFLYVQLGNLFNALNDDLGMAQKKVDGLTKNIETKKGELTQLQKERSDWAALHSNVVPTITAINNQLQRLGFHSFALAESGGDYALVRPDGAKANETLSEGERTLVTFLYFMERIYGADKGGGGGLREERLVVDDRILTNCINDLRGSNK